MLVLGIETSCDETGAAVVSSDGTVLSDVVESQVALHAEWGGVVPELASRDHLRNTGPVVREALAKAGLRLDQVDAIAVTCRPGLVGALLVGVQTAKGIAWGAGKPLVGVDHLVGHLVSVFLRREGETAQEELGFPYVGLLVSGGHTALYRVEGPCADQIHELGATRDDAAGEAFDKVGKVLGLAYPGGPRIDRLASEGDPLRVKLVPPMARRGSLEFSFSGIKTEVARRVASDGVPQGDALCDLCASFQSAVTGVLAKKLFEAVERERMDRVVLGGGVSANRELRRRVEELGRQKGIATLVPSLASATDNAAMIAYAGIKRLERGEVDGGDLVATSETVLEQLTRKGRGRRGT